MPNMDFAVAKNFLKSITAFKKFKSEVQYGDNNYEHFWEYAREHDLDDDFIQDAFSWEDSRDGYEYWEWVDDQWREWFNS